MYIIVMPIFNNFHFDEVSHLTDEQFKELINLVENHESIPLDIRQKCKDQLYQERLENYVNKIIQKHKPTKPKRRGGS